MYDECQSRVEALGTRGGAPNQVRLGRWDRNSCQWEVMPKPQPKGGAGSSQTKRTWKVSTAEETAYKRPAGMSSRVARWVGQHKETRKFYKAA